jgi:glycosyltransferase involved in cell wall biosynthesis
LTENIGANDRSEVRVLILFSAAGLGGAERSLSRMALANNRLDVTYLLGTLGGPGALADWIKDLGETPLVFSVLAGNGSRFLELLRLIRTIRVKTPNIVYVVGVRAAVFIRLLKPFLGHVKIVHGIRTTFQSRSTLAYKFLFPELVLQKCTTAYVANSDSGGKSLQRQFGISRNKIHIIPNGIVIPTSVLNFHGARTKSIVVVANLHPIKGHREFMDVVELVHRRHPDAKFHFVGRDDMDGEIQRIAELRGLSTVVEFAGFQSDVWPWLTSARLFALPSRDTEGSPTSILEALAAGLPAVAFAIGGIPDLIRDGI